ncbi:MAG: C39 family peptidase [Dehalococcoidia bacterium]|nr:C39 family peptidase [Dehalococcoidia bacterium]
MSKHKINVPYIWGGNVHCCHTTSLRMILEFYGIKHTTSYIMNLSGFNYGFYYYTEAKKAFGAPAGPHTPTPFMVYAAEKLGCKVETIRDKSWDISWKSLKQYIDKDIPIYTPTLNMQYLWRLEQPVPHVVVIVGYDEEKGVIMIHDPALGEVGDMEPYMFPIGLPEFPSGSYAEFKIEDFKKAWILEGTPWHALGNGMCVIRPTANRPKVNWAEVIDRNAKLTLGRVEEVIGAPTGSDERSGPEGIIQYANDLEKGFGLLEKPSQLIEILNFARTLPFSVGISCKIDASAFLAGLYAFTGNEDLYKASYYLRLTALRWEEGLAQIDLILRDEPISQELLSKRLNRISKTLNMSAEYQQKAGESLASAAKSLSRLES